VSNGLVSILGRNGWRWKQLPELFKDDLQLHNRLDMKKMDEEFNAKNCLQVGTVSQLIQNHVMPECTPNNFPLILGGDHCISIGTISAIKKARPDAAVVWVDAHADINTPTTSLSGNMHGMPLAYLLGLVENAKSMPGFQWFDPVLQPKDIVYIGLRELDRAEKMAIKRLGIKTFTMYHVDKYGIGKVMEECLDYIGNRNIHLSFDIDAIDPFYAPHTGTAVTGGLSFREGNYVCEALSESGNLSSMELVEVDPSLHQGLSKSETIDCALTLIGSAMGQKIL